MQLISVKQTEGLEAPAPGSPHVADGDSPTSDGDSREERAIELCEAMIDVTAALFNVSGKDLRRPGRSTLSVSRVRQVAMYVAHVVLKLSMTDIAKALGRDRTTVLYGCHLIEDLREDEEFDQIIAMTERVAAAAFGNRGEV